jgi:hypothetical protein
MNPSVTITTVANSTPQLVFSGTGRARFDGIGAVAVGDSAVNPADSATWLNASQVYDFKAPAEVYAACYSGTNQKVKVTVWF